MDGGGGGGIEAITPPLLDVHPPFCEAALGSIEGFWKAVTTNNGLTHHHHLRPHALVARGLFPHMWRLLNNLLHNLYVFVSLFIIVYVIPHDFFISTPGGSAEFRCIVEWHTVTDIQWIVNGSLLENLELTGVRTELGLEVGVGVLYFENLPSEYNETTIRCRARFTTSLGVQGTSTSPGATLLLLQGPLKLLCVHKIAQVHGLTT